MELTKRLETLPTSSSCVIILHLSASGQSMDMDISLHCVCFHVDIVLWHSLGTPLFRFRTPKVQAGSLLPCRRNAFPLKITISPGAFMGFLFRRIKNCP